MSGVSTMDPFVPGIEDENNPFSNSVPDSDLPAPADSSNPFGGGVDPGLEPAPLDNGGGGLMVADSMVAVVKMPPTPCLTTTLRNQVVAVSISVLPVAICPMEMLLIRSTLVAPYVR